MYMNSSWRVHNAYAPALVVTSGNVDAITLMHMSGHVLMRFMVHRAHTSRPLTDVRQRRVSDCCRGHHLWSTARLHLCFPLRHLLPLLCCRSHCYMLHLHLLLLMLHLHLLIASSVTAPPCSQTQQSLAFHIMSLACPHFTVAPLRLPPRPLHHNAVDGLPLFAVTRCSATLRRQYHSLAAPPRFFACTEHHVRRLHPHSA